MRLPLILCAAVLLAAPQAQQPERTGTWDAWRYLVSNWTAEGGGQPGQSTGTFSFHIDLQGKVLVRRSRADYPASSNHPAFSHEDLMVIYPGAHGDPFRAIYFDNEGHVIHYTARFSEDKKTVSFLSDPAPARPRFRLTYTQNNDGTLTVKFEIAPPDKPDLFSSYVEGIAWRKEAP